MTSKEYCEKYPNLMCVAKELSKLKNPYKAADALLAVAKSGLDNLTISEKDCSLTVSEVYATAKSADIFVN